MSIWKIFTKHKINVEMSQSEQSSETLKYPDLTLRGKVVLECLVLKAHHVVSGKKFEMTDI